MPYYKHREYKLSFLLRHDDSGAVDEHGWRDVSELIENHNYTLDELCEIVVNNNKQRFEFSKDKTLIRARQGHSIKVDVELEESMPPAVLCHGTASCFLDSINEKGILKGERLHVHLSETVETAVKVGKRHGDPVVLKIDAQKMHEDGIKFYLSRNNVWLTDYVEAKYIVEVL